MPERQSEPGVLRRLSARLLSGGATTDSLGVMLAFQGSEELQPGLLAIGAFANAVALETREGLLLVDAGSPFSAPAIQEAVRRFSSRPVHTLVYTHGHIDHVMGAGLFAAEARPAGSRLRIIGHEAVSARFDRYRDTAGYNGHINARQFQMPGLAWPIDYHYPDLAYRDRLDFDLGDERIELHHARGETDDHTFVFLPARRVLMTGDLFIWAAPNCGNPQKAQRYPREWARALRTMAALDAELLLPGHGPPIEGAAPVREALESTAMLLETIVTQTLALMNQGAPLEEVVRGVVVPGELLMRPWLRPVYDDPSFIVRSLWRLYGGWWDGNPAHLKPPEEARLAAAVCRVAGGVAALVAEARAAAERDELALAAQLIDWARLAAPDDVAASDAQAMIYTRRASAESSLMARSIFLSAARRTSL